MDKNNDAENICTGASPTSSTSERKVPHAGNPWEAGGGEGKYMYYPGGDRSAEPKEAPSAVNVVVVPDVTLPKVRIPPREDGETRDGDMQLRTGQQERTEANTDYRSCTTSTTSGARTATREVFEHLGAEDVMERKQGWHFGYGV